MIDQDQIVNVVQLKELFERHTWPRQRPLAHPSPGAVARGIIAAKEYRSRDRRKNLPFRLTFTQEVFVFILLERKVPRAAIARMVGLASPQSVKLRADPVYRAGNTNARKVNR